MLLALGLDSSTELRSRPRDTLAAAMVVTAAAAAADTASGGMLLQLQCNTLPSLKQKAGVHAPRRLSHSFCPARRTLCKGTEECT
jgi:hypothetical protein